jgi:hypothetical protein
MKQHCFDLIQLQHYYKLGYSFFENITIVVVSNLEVHLLTLKGNGDMERTERHLPCPLHARDIWYDVISPSGLL